MNLLKELLQFLGELNQYKEILTNPDSKLLEAKRKVELFAAFPFLQEALPKKSKEEVKEELREGLLRKSGALSSKIIKLTGRQYFTKGMSKYDMWAVAFNPLIKMQEIALAFCIDAVNEAIGKLESTPITELGTQKTSILESPKAFIAHGGRSGVLDKLREFIQALGIDPLIVELLPTRGMSVDDKVNKYIKDADCGIVLATKGGIIDIKSEKQHPRLNVIDEFERLRAAFPEKTILLVERGVDLPSNISGLTHEPFVGQSMDRAFSAIARELVAFGILKAVKPQIEELKI